MNISLRCILGHKWESYGYGDMIRKCDGKVVGYFIIQRCTVCGKVNQKKFT